MKIASYEVPAGAAFFHGTKDWRVIEQSQFVRPSSAHPCGVRISKFAWFFSEEAAALNYCKPVIESGPGRLIHVRLTENVLLADLRHLVWLDIESHEIIAGYCGEQLLSELLWERGFAGVAIPNTTSAHAVEFGFCPEAPIELLSTILPTAEWTAQQASEERALDEKIKADFARRGIDWTP